MIRSEKVGEKRWPKPGDQLVHKIRGREVFAEVLSVNRDNANVSVKIGGKVYTSLSAAAKFVSGCETNGWIYWRLKTQIRPPKQKRSSG